METEMEFHPGRALLEEENSGGGARHEEDPGDAVDPSSIFKDPIVGTARVSSKNLYLRKILFRNFRTYENHEFLFHPGSNLVVGDNGAGKSSLLNAIELLLTLVDSERSEHFFRQKCAKFLEDAKIRIEGPGEREIEGTLIENEGSLQEKEHVLTVHATAEATSDISFKWNRRAISRNALRKKILTEKFPRFTVFSLSFSKNLNLSRKKMYLERIKETMSHDRWSAVCKKLYETYESLLRIIYDNNLEADHRAFLRSSAEHESSLVQNIESLKGISAFLGDIIAERKRKAQAERTTAEKRKEVEDQISELKASLKELRTSNIQINEEEPNQESVELREQRTLALREEISSKERSINQRNVTIQVLHEDSKRLKEIQTKRDLKKLEIEQLDKAYEDCEKALKSSTSKLNALRMKLTSHGDFIRKETAEKNLQEEIRNMEEYNTTLEKQLSIWFPKQERLKNALKDLDEAISGDEQQITLMEEVIPKTAMDLESTRQHLLDIKLQLEQLMIDEGRQLLKRKSIAAFAETVGSSLTLIYLDYENIVNEVYATLDVDSRNPTIFGTVFDLIDVQAKFRGAMLAVKQILKTLVVKDMRTAICLKKTLEARNLEREVVSIICLDEYVAPQGSETAIKQKDESVPLVNALMIKNDCALMGAPGYIEKFKNFMISEFMRYHVVTVPESREVSTASRLASVNKSYKFITSRGFMASKCEFSVNASHSSRDIIDLFGKFKAELKNSLELEQMKERINALKPEVRSLEQQLESQMMMSSSLRADMRRKEAERDSIQRQLQQVMSSVKAPTEEKTKIVSQIASKIKFLEELQQGGGQSHDMSLDNLLKEISEEQILKQDTEQKMRELAKTLQNESNLAHLLSKDIDDFKLEMEKGNVELELQQKAAEEEEVVHLRALLADLIEIASPVHRDESMRARIVDEKLRRENRIVDLKEMIRMKQEELSTFNNEIFPTEEVDIDLSDLDAGQIEHVLRRHNLGIISIGRLEQERGNVSRSVKNSEKKLREFLSVNEKIESDERLHREVCVLFEEINPLRVSSQLRRECETDAILRLGESFTEIFKSMVPFGDGELQAGNLFAEQQQRFQELRIGRKKINVEKQLSILDKTDINFSVSFLEDGTVIPLDYLSVGQQHIVHVALCASLCRIRPPMLILFDEVDEALDDSNCERLRELQNRLALQSQFMFVSHRPELYSNTADHIIKVNRTRRE